MWRLGPKTWEIKDIKIALSCTHPNHCLLKYGLE